ncbi:MAG: hypothetical protein EXX96DRAFT_499255 [Benjaminiella poitrasii]|nr:MAG: hypothetical protein EXX96DRAFT_499255 [Benjaminiella poitrasii]
MNRRRSISTSVPSTENSKKSIHSRPLFSRFRTISNNATKTMIKPIVSSAPTTTLSIQGQQAIKRKPIAKYETILGIEESEKVSLKNINASHKKGSSSSLVSRRGNFLFKRKQTVNVSYNELDEMSTSLSFAASTTKDQALASKTKRHDGPRNMTKKQSASTGTCSSQGTRGNEKARDLVQIVSDNLQTGRRRRYIDEGKSAKTNDEEREKIETRLSKRFSVGHYGSAGGLIVSTTDPSKDVAQSMMKWKRQSKSTVDQECIPNEQQSDKEAADNDSNKNSFSLPEIRLSMSHVNYNSSNKELSAKGDSPLNDPKECALRLWNEDSSFVERERIAEWLGQGKSLNSRTLKEYMGYFDFSTLRLDSAFRKMCSKLYFRAEAQQIDRILEAFAKQYWQCNPKSVLGNSDVIYAVVYSLLLLNTDLHVAQGNYTRMTRQEFVKNTMSTLRDQQRQMNSKPYDSILWEAHIESYLKDMYVSVKNYQILQPMQHQQLENNSSFASIRNNKRISMMDIKRSLNTIIHKPGRESIFILDEPVPRKSTSSFTRQQNSNNSKKRRSSFASSRSVPNTVLSVSPGISHLSPQFPQRLDDSVSNNDRPPYLKKGIVMRKRLLAKANQKSKHREWRECLLVVGYGQLNMYGLVISSSENSASDTPSRKSIIMRAHNASFTSLADTISKNHPFNNPSSSLSQRKDYPSTAYSQLIGSIQLNHSLASPLPPPGYNRHRPHVFAIQEPNGGVHLIQTTSNEQMIEWVSICNYWAARQSKEPLQGGVSNTEYGWGNCLDDVILDLDAVEKNKKVTGHYFHDPDKVHVFQWNPTAPTMVSSVLNEKAQLKSLQKYVSLLNKEINEHREIKKKILVKFQTKSQNRTKVLQNWEAKSTYILHEIIKYQNYCNALEDRIISCKSQEEN